MWPSFSVVRLKDLLISHVDSFFLGFCPHNLTKVSNWDFFSFIIHPDIWAMFFADKGITSSVLLSLHFACLGAVSLAPTFASLYFECYTQGSLALWSLKLVSNLHICCCWPGAHLPVSIMSAIPRALWHCEVTSSCKTCISVVYGCQRGVILSWWVFSLWSGEVGFHQRFSIGDLFAFMHTKFFHTLLHLELKYSLHYNSLWISDAICWHRSGSTWAPVMARCLMAPSHYLNQCWLCNHLGDHLKAIWLEMLKISILVVGLKILSTDGHLSVWTNPQHDASLDG